MIRNRPFLIGICMLILASLACSTLFGAETPPPAAAPVVGETQPPTQTLLDTAMPPPALTTTPTLSPTVTVEAGEAQTSVLVAGPCDNVLYPLVEGNQWIYLVRSQEGDDQLGMTVAQVENSQATIQTLYLSTGITSTTTATCDDGALLSFPATALGIFYAEAAGSLEVAYASGVFAPALREFENNQWDLAWESDFVASGEFEATVEGETSQLTLGESPVSIDWRTAGRGEAAFEAVAVPAGEFPRALKVIRSMTMELQLMLLQEDLDLSIPATLTIESTLWFEPHVGLLKHVINHTELTFFGGVYPLALESTLELKEFHR